MKSHVSLSFLLRYRSLPLQRVKVDLSPGETTPRSHPAFTLVGHRRTKVKSSQRVNERQRRRRPRVDKGEGWRKRECRKTFSWIPVKTWHRGTTFVVSTRKCSYNLYFYPRDNVSRKSPPWRPEPLDTPPSSNPPNLSSSSFLKCKIKWTEPPNLTRDLYRLFTYLWSHYYPSSSPVDVDFIFVTTLV